MVPEDRPGNSTRASRRTKSKWRLIGLASGVPLCAAYILARKDGQANGALSWLFAAAVAGAAFGAWWLVDRADKTNPTKRRRSRRG